MLNMRAAAVSLVFSTKHECSGCAANIFSGHSYDFLWQNLLEWWVCLICLMDFVVSGKAFPLQAYVWSQKGVLSQACAELAPA